MRPINPPRRWIRSDHDPNYRRSAASNWRNNDGFAGCSSRGNPRGSAAHRCCVGFADGIGSGLAARGGEWSRATEDQAIEIVVEFPEIVEAGIAFAQYAGSPVNFCINVLQGGLLL